MKLHNITAIRVFILIINLIRVYIKTLKEYRFKFFDYIPLSISKR